MAVQDIETQSEATIAAAKAFLGGKENGATGAVAIQKSITQATGLVAYNLEPVAKTLVPAITPLRNRFPRVANTRGGSAVNYKVITALDISRTDLFTAEATKAGTVSYSVTSKAVSFATVSKGDNVSFQAQWAGRGFEDVKAHTLIRLLKHVMIHEEQALLGGRTTTMSNPSAPTVASTSTGGTIGAATYNVYVVALTNVGRGQASTATSTGALSGSTNTINASVPWVEGATQYAWYVGTAGNEKLEQTTTINSVNLTALAGTGATFASWVNNGADANGFDGVIAQLTAANGAQVKTLATGTNGTGTTFALSDIDTMNKLVWDNARANPDYIFVSSQQSVDLTNKVLAAAGAPTLYVQNNANEKAAITGGYRVESYINKVTGKPIPIITHPYLNAGTMFGLTLEMPFPASDITNPIEIETRQEYLQIDYPVIAPKWEFEVMVDEVLKMFFPGSCWVIRNIAAG